MNTLGEIEGFVGSQEYDHIVVAGDFNVDFDRGGPIATLLDELFLNLVWLSVICHIEMISNSLMKETMD